MNTFDEIRDAVIAHPNLAELSRTSGVSYRTLFRIRAGERRATLSTVEKLEKALPAKRRIRRA